MGKTLREPRKPLSRDSIEHPELLVIEGIAVFIEVAHLARPSLLIRSLTWEAAHNTKEGRILLVHGLRRQQQRQESHGKGTLVIVPIHMPSMPNVSAKNMDGHLAFNKSLAYIYIKVGEGAGRGVAVRPNAPPATPPHPLDTMI